jgi:phage baseplate assembly protein V
MANLEYGVISEIDFVSGLARVKFLDDGLVSAPLKISVMRSGPDQFIFPFDVNEHVWCLMDDECEYGVIGGAIYDEGNVPPEVSKGILKLKFADNSAIEYNRNSHILSFDIQGKVSIKCDEANLTCADSANITAKQVNIDGIVNIAGAANIQGVVSVGGLAGINGGPVDAGEAAINAKSLEVTGDVKAGEVSLKQHKHTSTGSGSPTSIPI